jgi:predicted transcriptional regulator
MVDKGYLKRTEKGNAYLFSPRVKRDAVSQKMLGDLVDRVFDGSARAVMLSLFDCTKLGADEFKELRHLIDAEAKRRANQ